MKKIQNFIESFSFGVCTKLGDKLGIPTSKIRIYFIYATFLTFGSPVILYLALAFWMDLRSFFRKRNSIWDY